MLIGAVVHHEIENDAHIALLRSAHHLVEIAERAVHGINVFVIGHVVAEINLRRRKAGSYPDGVNAQAFQIIEF